MPWSGPRSVPSARSSSAWRASRSARSRVTVTTAFNVGAWVSRRSRKCSVNATEVISPAPSNRPSSTGDAYESSSLIGHPSRVKVRADPVRQVELGQVCAECDAAGDTPANFVDLLIGESVGEPVRDRLHPALDLALRVLRLRGVAVFGHLARICSHTCSLACAAITPIRVHDRIVRPEPAPSGRQSPADANRAPDESDTR